MLKVGAKTWVLAKPFAKRRARKRAQRIGETAKGLAMTVTTYAPDLARVVASLGPQKKRNRPAPRVLASAVLGTGAAVGAAAVYFFETEDGRERRRRLRRKAS